MNKLICNFVFFGAVLIGANAQADTVGLTAITVNGDKMVNDSVLDVTWADVVPTAAFNWPGANSWVNSLNTLSYGGHNDWRLATDNGSGGNGPNIVFNFNYGDCGNNSPDELGCLFINELGNIYGIKSTNFSPFSNLEEQVYWSATEESYLSKAYAFGTGNSQSGLQFQYSNSKALAVRTGQTLEAPPPVTPIPATSWLLLSALGGLGLMSRKRKTL